MSQKVKASYFDGRTGCYGDNLYDGKYYYAEVSKLSKDYTKKYSCALGCLPKHQKLKITYKGKSVVAIKGDQIIGGENDAVIYIHIVLAKKLGFDLNKGIDTVIIEEIK